MARAVLQLAGDHRIGLCALQASIHPLPVLANLPDYFAGIKRAVKGTFIRFPSLYDNDKITEHAGCKSRLELKSYSSEGGSSEDFARRSGKPEHQYCAFKPPSFAFSRRVRIAPGGGHFGQTLYCANWWQHVGLNNLCWKRQLPHISAMLGQLMMITSPYVADCPAATSLVCMLATISRVG